MGKIFCVVYGFYGGNDVWVNVMLEKIVVVMKVVGKMFELVIYDGVGYVFMWLGEDVVLMVVNKVVME